MTHPAQGAVSGILNIRKEAGFTSFDVIAVLRGILHTRRIGHTGTLDPAAEGVLPVCVGKATSLVEMLTDKTKTYETVMLLGVTTDTQDTTGNILSRTEEIPAEEEVLSAIRSFEGTYEQLPPMVSAKKVNGRKLVDLAREGKTVERRPVPVTLSDITILSVDLPRVRFSVTCTRGTYIRTLCADIGEKLGCGACMESLLRTRSGDFRLEDAVTLDDVRRAVEEERLDSLLLTLEEVFADLPALAVLPEGEKRLLNGNPVPCRMAQEAPEGAQRVRIRGLDGALIGVYRLDEAEGVWKPDRLFLRD